MTTEALKKHYYAADVRFLPIVSKARAFDELARRGETIPERN